MKGLCLSSLTRELHKVDPAFANQPVNSIEGVEQKLGFCRQYIDSCFSAFTFQNDYFQLSLGALRNFSFDELCKLKYSTRITMERSVTEVFEKRPNHEVIRKITSSMWRWGMGKGTWNEVVDAYEGIQNFSLGLNSDFEIRLDYTTGYNEFGHSKFSRTYIDGVFAFLVYYKRRHVMTIGFSFMENHRVLIQQVQLKKQSGNRWLYKFPKNRLEFVIDLCAKYFPHFSLYMINGKSLVKKTIADYENGLRRAEKRIERDLRYAAADPGHCDADIKEDEDAVAEFKARIAHLNGDIKRLTRLYSDCGRHYLAGLLVVNRITHYKLELQ